MMSLIFCLFTQVSNSGPNGPLVFSQYCTGQNCLVVIISSHDSDSVFALNGLM